MYAYAASPDDPNEISFAKGETLDVIDNTGKWWQVRNAAGQAGVSVIHRAKLTRRLLPPTIYLCSDAMKSFLALLFLLLLRLGRGAGFGAGHILFRIVRRGGGRVFGGLCAPDGFGFRVG